MDRRPAWISFTTDYGLADGFVAACHGVIATTAPEARVIDVTHLVPPGDVARGARVLAQTVPSLPRGVHLAVVDPGVGTARRPIAVVAVDGSVLVGPDNGLLIPAAEALGGVRDAVHLTKRDWFSPVVSRTFHGRDIFAKVAARVAGGDDVMIAGVAISDVVRLDPPTLINLPNGFTAEVVMVDRFGNVQLAAAEGQLAGTDATVNGRKAVVGGTFGDVEAGGLVVFADSAGHVAVAVNGGSAADVLGVRTGDELTVLTNDGRTGPRI